MPRAHTAQGAHQHGEGEELLFPAGEVGDGAQHRAAQGHHQGGDGGGVAPVGQVAHLGEARPNSRALRC